MEVVGGIIFISILVYFSLSGISKNKQRKEYYLDKAQELYMKGEIREADKYIELASRIR